MSEDILTEKRKRRKFERMWRASKLTVHHQMYCEQRDRVNGLIQKAKVTHYETKVIDCGSDQKALFGVVKSLMHRKEEKPCVLSADAFSDFFVCKIRKIRQGFPETDCSHPPEKSLTSERLSDFCPVTENEVQKIIMRSPTKSCSLDPWPTWLLKQNLTPLLPSITRIINQSLFCGHVPAVMKRALVTPLLKKSTLDPDVPGNYRPVSNLMFLSKVLERVVACQLSKYLDEQSLHHPFQSAYRANHSVETALTKVHNDIMMSLDQQEGVILVMLDLSAAFDTVDHAVLLTRLKDRFGVCDSVLNWIRSYLSGRSQSVVVGNTTSQATPLEYGVPQGSVLGPILFSMYVSPLGDIADQFKVYNHQYADDCELYVPFRLKQLSSMSKSREAVEGCVAEIGAWMMRNKLKQNDSKTELVVLAPPRIERSVLPSKLHVGEVLVRATPSARNLGCTWDEVMSMEAHVKNICSTCHYYLHNIGAMRSSLTRDATERVVHAFITSRLDSCNTLLYNLPKVLLLKLQRVQNTAARIVTRASKHDSATAILKDLHWLPITARIEYKICSMTWKALNGRAPAYISDLLTPYTAARTLRSSNQALLSVPRCRLNYGERAFSVAAPKLWNDLPVSIRELKHYDTFKAKLKTYLFNIHLNSSR